MLDFSNIIYLKREKFLINIRRERNERQFKELRSNFLNKIFQELSEIQQITNESREVLLQGEYLQGEKLLQMVKIISDNIGMQNNILNLLDIIDAAIWMMKSIESCDYEEYLCENEDMQKIIEKIILLSQGYGIDNEKCNQQVIIYAAKFLKYWTLHEDKLLYKYFGLLAETIYFLLIKEEEIFVKRGVDLLMNVAFAFEGQLLSQIYELIIFDQKLVNTIFSQLQKNRSQDIQFSLWSTILQSFLASDIVGINQYLKFQNNETKQSLFEMLIDQIVNSEEDSKKQFKMKLHLLFSILEYCETEDEEKFQIYIQTLKAHTFLMKLTNEWLFHEWNSISRLAHEIQAYLQE